MTDEGLAQVADDKNGGIVNLTGGIACVKQDVADGSEMWTLTAGEHE